VSDTLTVPSAWWPVATDAAVGDKPVPSTIGDHELVLFRDKAGEVHVFDDRCPHSLAPLSLGWVTDEGYLQCGYHGWCFEGKTGRCAVIPNYRAEERVPARFVVVRHSAVESGGLVFAWAGEHPDEPPRLEAGGTGPVTCGHFTVTLPHEAVVQALLADPAATLGLRWLRPVEGTARVTRGPGRVEVERPLDAPQSKLWAALLKDEAQLHVTTLAVTGASVIEVQTVEGAGVVQLAVGITPKDRWSSQVCWRLQWQRAPLRLLGRLGRPRPLTSTPPRPEGSVAGAVEAWRSFGSPSVRPDDDVTERSLEEVGT
jgi:nitrite reductase/ring-hydroxylating ferredoxin subunit